MISLRNVELPPWHGQVLFMFRQVRRMEHTCLRLNKLEYAPTLKISMIGIILL